MKLILILGIIFLVLLLIVFLIVFIAVTKISRKVSRIQSKASNFARMAWGTDSITEGIEKAQWEYSTTPKSVSAGTSLYLPRISKDFPDFHYEEMKERANNVLISYLRAIDGGQVSLLEEGTDELKEQLETYIEMLEQKDLKEHFERIKVHRTEIYKYIKDAGRCTVIFQTAIEYIHYIDQNGVVKKGRKEMKEQGRYNIEMIYIQDRDLIEDTGDFALGINCPNCGGAISSLGAKVCKYCGTPVVELNIKSWHFSKISKA